MSQDDHAPTPISPTEAAARFADAWVAGTRPNVHHYIELVAEADADEVCDLISDYLVYAPTPTLTPEAQEALNNDPLFIKVLDATIHLEGLLGSLEIPEDLQ